MDTKQMYYYSYLLVLFLMMFNGGLCFESEGENEDNEDERHHRAEHGSCPDGDFSCPNDDQCIPARFRCDGSMDCNDGADEHGCASGRCQMDRNKLKNGRIKLRSRGRIAKFVCDPGYELAGKRFATCVNGRWNNPIPVCVARGCYRQRSVPNGQITEMYRGAMLVFTCNPGYALEGSETIFCDGRKWNSTAPDCIVAAVEPETSCDFENRNLCGWSHDPLNDFDWKRNQFTTPSGHVGTGPSYDHTFGMGKGGFYLYTEASSPRRVNDTARLFSPVFPSVDSDSCFVFWYHMYGASTGGFRVYLKTERHVFGELSPVWEKWGDQGNQWRRGHVAVPQLQENFQIVIEGVRGTSYVGDSAIDDVSLTKGTCENLENSTDTVEHTAAESCRGRCKEHIDYASCGCNENCVTEENCCQDYSRYCASGNDTSVENPDEPLPDSELAQSSSPVTVTIAKLSSLKSTEEATTFQPSTITTGFSTSTAATITPVVLSSKTATTTLPSTSLLPQLTTKIITPSSTTVLSTARATTELSTRKTTTALPTLRTITTPRTTSTSVSTDRTNSPSSVTASVISKTTIAPTRKTNVPAVSKVVTLPVTERRTTISSTTTTTTKSSTPTIKTTTSTISPSPITSTTISSTTKRSSSSIPITSTIAPTESSSSKMSIPSTASPTSSSTTTDFTTSTSSIVTSTPSTRKTYNLRPRTQKTTPVSIQSSSVSSTSNRIITTETSSRTTATINTRKISDLPVTPNSASKYSYRVFATTTWYDLKSSSSSVNFRTRIYNRPTSTTTYPSKTTARLIIHRQSSTETTNKFTSQNQRITASTLSATIASDSSLSQASKEASTANKGGLPTTAIVSIAAVAILCAAAGLVYYMRVQKSKRQSKLSDDSEMRFLSENEVSEYSDASVLDKILIK